MTRKAQIFHRGRRVKPAAIGLSAAIVVVGVALANAELQNLAVSSAVAYVTGLLGLMLMVVTLWKLGLQLEVELEAVSAELEAVSAERVSDRAMHHKFIQDTLSGIIRKERERELRAAAAARDRGKYGVRLRGSESTIPTPVVAEPTSVPPAA